jgi:hypothetical protein
LTVSPMTVKLLETVDPIVPRTTSLAELDEGIELALYEWYGTFELGKYDHTLLTGPTIRDGLIEDRIKLTKIINDLVGVLACLGPCTFDVMLRDIRAPQQPHRDRFVLVGEHVEARDKSPERNMIAGKSMNLNYEVVLQRCRNAEHDTEDD